MTSRSFDIFNRYTLLAAHYFAALSVASHIPGDIMQQVGFNIWDKGLHFSAYAPLGALLAVGFRRAVSRPLLVAAITVLLLGVLDEFHQSFVPGRFPSIGDVIADVLGGSAGAIVVLRVLSLWTAKKDRASPA